MNSIENLSNILNKLRKEYSIFISQLRAGNSKDIPKIIQKYHVIKQLMKLTYSEIINIKFYSDTYNSYIKQKNLNKLYCTQEAKINSILSSSLKVLTKGLPFFNLSINENKFNVSTISNKNFINLTLRLNKQNDYPLDLQKYEGTPLAYLTPFPNEDKEMLNSILKFDLRDSKRLLPPIVSPNQESVSRGTFIKMTYPDPKVMKSNQPVFFKYILYPINVNLQEIPSFFSGKIYNEIVAITIEEDSILKVCSCRIGYKDSVVKTFKYYVNLETQNKASIINLKAQNEKFVERPSLEMVSEHGGFRPYMQLKINSDYENSPRSGSSSMHQRSIHQQSFIQGDLSSDDEGI